MGTKKGTGKNDHLKGGDDDDVLLGLGGDDTLDGGAGSDEIFAGDGDDVIVGRLEGDDAIDGGKGTDTLSYAKLTTGVVAVIGASGRGYFPKSEGADIDAIRNVENFVLTKASDNFTAMRAKGGYAYGGAGDDLIHVYGGIARGDAGEDTLVADVDRESEEIFWLQRGKTADIVQNYTSWQDSIRISRKEFDVGNLVGYDEFIYRHSSTAAVGTKAQFIYDEDNRELYYDPDGTGDDAVELIATFSNGAPRPEDFEIV